MSRHVLVLNAGSSSIKYRLIDVDDNTPSAQGLIERIGEPSGSIHHRGPAGEVQTDRDFPDHEHALRAALSAFEQAGPSLNQTELIAVGHRVVHGGDTFSQPVVIDDDVVDAIEGLVPLAPLHNPANLRGITVARRVFADVPQVAVFDTAFHQSLPPHAYTYAVPQKWRTQYDVRRYGFHGISHDLVSRTAAETLGRDPRTTNLIVLHLGNGASATAVAGGRS
ncbi:MAG TPA: acetate kinase, partial [Jiangellaceae bacterium]|nr:acetate kinase [Jiangellaceae bacterium]